MNMSEFTDYDDSYNWYTLRFSTSFDNIEHGLKTFISKYKTKLVIGFYLIEEVISSDSTPQRFIEKSKHCHAIMMVPKGKKDNTWRVAIKTHVCKPAGLVGNGSYSFQPLKLGKRDEMKDAYDAYCRYMHKQYDRTRGDPDVFKLDIEIVKLVHGITLRPETLFQEYWEEHKRSKALRKKNNRKSKIWQIRF